MLTDHATDMLTQVQRMCWVFKDNSVRNQCGAIESQVSTSINQDQQMASLDREN